MTAHHTLVESPLFANALRAYMQVRLPADFEGLDAIVLPGGESTAMALIGER